MIMALFKSNFLNRLAEWIATPFIVLIGLAVAAVFAGWGRDDEG
jgi:hypothetical protein